MIKELYKNNIKKLDIDLNLNDYLLILDKVDELLDELESSGFIGNLNLLNESVVYKECVDLSSIGVTSISLIISAEDKPKLILTHGGMFKKFSLLYGHNIYYCIYKIEVNSLFLSSLNLSEKDCGFFIEYTDLTVCSNELNLINVNLTMYSDLNNLNLDTFIDSIYCHFGQLELLNNLRCNYLFIEYKSTNGRNMSRYKQIIVDIIKNVNDYMIINLPLEEVYSSLCNSLSESHILFERYYTNEKYILFINCKRN